MVLGYRPEDLYRCESVTLQSHWVMVVIDDFLEGLLDLLCMPVIVMALPIVECSTR
jgi:hypothetical protein